MTIKALYPTIAPTLNLSFALTKSLDPRITFARAGSATYYGTRTVKAEENRFLQSQNFVTSWTQTRTVRTANAAQAPDGTTTAATVFQIAGQTTAGVVSQTLNAVTGDFVVSVFAKPNGRNFLVIREGLLDATNNDTYFNVSTGAIGTTDAGHTATITASENGYYRCSIKFTVNAARSAGVSFYIADTDGTLTVADDGNGLNLWGAQAEARTTLTAYTPTTTQPITRYQPVLETAASGVARFDHSPITGESLGFLVEEQRVNLLLRSEEFDSGSWVKTNVTQFVDTIIAPNGTLTGEKYIATSTNGNHFNAQTITVTSGTTYTLSVYLKAGEYIWTRLYFGSAAFPPNNRAASFNLSTGTVGATQSGVTAAISPAGNGWYRCSISVAATSSAGDSCGFNVQNADSATSTSFAGNGFDGFYAWGAQLEAGSQATSYIKTVGSQVTRPADAASMTGANFSSWYNQAEGTAYVEASSTVSSSKISFSDNTASNRLLLDTTTTSVRLLVTTNGSTQAAPVIAYQSGFAKMAAFFKTNSFNIAQNGTLGTLDTVGAMPLVDRMYIGGGSLGTVSGVNHFKKIAYLPKASTATQIQALTS